MARNITRSSEDYLEAILVIRQAKGQCRSIDVATHLNLIYKAGTNCTNETGTFGLPVAPPCA